MGDMLVAKTTNRFELAGSARFPCLLDRLFEAGKRLRGALIPGGLRKVTARLIG